MTKQCRLCAKFTDSSIDLFLQHENTLLTNINSFLPITISKDIDLPTKICCKCVELSNATHSFIRQILLAQEIFGISSDSPLKRTMPTNSVTYGGVTIRSMNQETINVPPVQNHKKPVNMSEALKKLQKTGMTISKTMTLTKTKVPGTKRVKSEPVESTPTTRRCKTERTSYFNGSDDSEPDYGGTDDNDDDPTFDDGASDSSDSVNIIEDDDDDDDYEPYKKKKKEKPTVTKNDTKKPATSENAADKDAKYKAIKINAPPVFLCMKCKNRFPSLDELKRHVLEKNMCSVSQPKCKVCDKVFDNRKRLSAHMKTHEEKTKYICDKCGKVYMNQFNLENHRSSQHGEYVDGTTRISNAFKCRLCDAKFNNGTDLYIHMKNHPKGFQELLCDICGKSFSNSHNLNAHIRIHRDIRPHACTFCPKQFRTRLLLRQHTHVHTGIKEFQCSVCQQSFAKRDSLRAHLRKRHGVQPNSQNMIIATDTVEQKPSSEDIEEEIQV